MTALFGERGLTRWALLSLLAAILTLSIKGTAYFLTGSIAVLSDAMESTINILTALMALFALWYSAQPVDLDHTYGHKKIEYFSSGLEGTLILLAAGGIAWKAITGLFEPAMPTAIDLGAGLVILATLINLAVGTTLLRVARAKESLVLRADGIHLLSDVWTSGGVLAGLFLVWLTRLAVLDAAVGLAVAIYVGRGGLGLAWHAVHGLLDQALPPAEQDLIRQAIERQLQPGMTYHGLRTRQAGSLRFADVHVLVPGLLTVRLAHELTLRIEAAVREALPGTEVLVHIEPIEESSAWDDTALALREPPDRSAKRRSS